MGSPTDWQSAPSAGDLPLIPAPLLHGCDYAQSTYHINPFMMPIPPVQQQGCYEHKNDVHLPTLQMLGGGSCAEMSYSYSHNTELQPCSELNVHSHAINGKSHAETKKEDSFKQCLHDAITSGHAQSVHDQWRPSVIVKVEKNEQSVNSDPKDVTSDDNSAEKKSSGEITLDSKEKNIQSAERKKVSKTDKSSPGKDINVESASPRYSIYDLTYSKLTYF